MQLRRPMRLRTKVSLLFGIIALIATVSLTVVTYAFARSSLLEQREELARTQGVSNALRVRELLAVPGDAGRLANLRIESGGFAVAVAGRRRVRHRQLPVLRRQLPVRAPPVGRRRRRRRAALRGRRRALPRRRRQDRRARRRLLRGLPPRPDRGHAADDPARARHRLRDHGPAGQLRRLVDERPACCARSGGSPTPPARSPPATSTPASPREGDPDLDRLADSFNGMADAVQARIEREARFASDVSHELRSPITALAAAAEVIDGRRGELPDRTQQALDVVVGQVRRFDAMVIDLLELSRIDAGATDLHTEQVDIETLCRRVAARNGFADLPIEVDQGARHERRPDDGHRRPPALRAHPHQPARERPPPRRRADARRRSSRPTARSCSSPSRTPGPAWPAASGRASSSASPGAARPATASAPGSGSPSSPSTPPPRAARRGSRTGRAAAPASSCACPWGRPVKRLRRRRRRCRSARSSARLRAASAATTSCRRSTSRTCSGSTRRRPRRRRRRRCRRRRRRSSSRPSRRRRRRSPRESVQLFFVDGTRLQPVTLDLAGTPTPNRVIQALLDGLPDGDDRHRPAHAAAAAASSTTSTRPAPATATVDLATEPFNRIDPADQRTAIGQIVMTLVNRPGIGQVRFTLDGEPQRVPREDGLQSEPGERVSLNDYESLLDPAEDDDRPPTTARRRRRRHRRRRRRHRCRPDGRPSACGDRAAVRVGGRPTPRPRRPGCADRRLASRRGTGAARRRPGAPTTPAVGHGGEIAKWRWQALARPVRPIRPRRCPMPTRTPASMPSSIASKWAR